MTSVIQKEIYSLAVVIICDYYTYSREEVKKHYKLSSDFTWDILVADETSHGVIILKSYMYTVLFIFVCIFLLKSSAVFVN